MRISYALSFVLAIGGATPVQGQQFAPNQNLEARFIKACLKDGDVEAYCRCDFDATKGAVKDAKELEFIVALSEKMAGLPDEAQQEILKQLPPDQLQRLIELAGQMEPIVQKCPGYKPRK